MKLSLIKKIVFIAMFLMVIACDDDGGSGTKDTSTDTDSDTNTATGNDTVTTGGDTNTTGGDTNTTVDTGTGTDTSVDTGTGTGTTVDTGTGTGTAVDTGTGTDTTVDTGTGTDTTVDTGTGEPTTADLEDLREIALDGAAKMFVTVRDSTSTGHDNIGVNYYYSHDPQMPLLEWTETVMIDSLPTNASGVSSANLNEGSYTVTINNFTEALSTNVHTTEDCSAATLTVGCNGYKGNDVATLPTVITAENTAAVDNIVNTARRVTFSVDAPATNVDLLTVDIRIFKTDETGMPIDETAVGFFNSPLKTLSFDTSVESSSMEDAFTAAVEMFPGYYRAIVTATAQNEDTLADVVIHPFDTGVFTVASQNVPVNVDLSDSGNDVTLTARERNYTPSDIDIPGTVTVYDCQTGWVIASGPAGIGEDPINTGNFTNVIAVFQGTTSGGVAMTGGYHFSDLTGEKDMKLTERFIDTNGLPSGNSVAGAVVRFAQFFDASCNGVQAIYMDSAPVNTSDGTTTDTSIFGSPSAQGGLDYQVYVVGMADYFLDTFEEVNSVSSVDPDAVNLSATEGGTIAGNINQRNGENPIENTAVMAYEQTGTGGAFGPVYSQADGTYELDVPAGTYIVSVGSALTPDVEVTSGQTTSRNFLRGPYSGITTRSSDSQGIDFASFWGTGATTTDVNGFFTLEFYDGINYTCVNPNNSPTGHNVVFECFYNLAIDALADLDD